MMKNVTSSLPLLLLLASVSVVQVLHVLLLQTNNVLLVSSFTATTSNTIHIHHRAKKINYAPKPNNNSNKKINNKTFIGATTDPNNSDEYDDLSSRRDIIKQVFIGSTTAASILLGGGKNHNEAQALVEGNKPPSSSKQFKSLPEDYMQGTSALADMDANAPLPKEAYQKLPSGIIYADLRPGNGDIEITQGSKVNLQWVLRKSNGYFVDSSAVQNDVPFIFTVGDTSNNGAIEGVDVGVRGMRAGGTRRLLIPPSLAYVKGLEDGLPGPLPAGFGPKQQMRRVQNVRKDVPGEYVFLEVQVTRVR